MLTEMMMMIAYGVDLNKKNIYFQMVDVPWNQLVEYDVEHLAYLTWFVDRELDDSEVLARH